MSFELPKLVKKSKRWLVIQFLMTSCDAVTVTDSISLRRWFSTITQHDLELIVFKEIGCGEMDTRLRVRALRSICLHYHIREFNDISGHWFARFCVILYDGTFRVLKRDAADD